MRLSDLSPSWIRNGDRSGVAVSFDCPCQAEHAPGISPRVAVYLSNPLDGGSSLRDGWRRTGDTFDTLTLHPSIQRAEPNGCRWHGWIKNGEAITC